MLTLQETIRTTTVTEPQQSNCGGDMKIKLWIRLNDAFGMGWIARIHAGTYYATSCYDTGWQISSEPNLQRNMWRFSSELIDHPVLSFICSTSVVTSASGLSVVSLFYLRYIQLWISWVDPKCIQNQGLSKLGVILADTQYRLHLAGRN